MKKSIILSIVVLLLLFSMLGCVKTEVEDTENEVEVLTGYIVIEDNNLHFDQVEIVKIENKERMEELDLDESDMPNAIINENQEKTTYELADKVVYKFTDINLNFIEESESEGDRVYITTKKDEFLKHLGEYNLNDVPLSLL